MSSIPNEKTLDSLSQSQGEKCESLVSLIQKMNTNGFAVERAGKTLWQYYDIHHGPKTPHVLWSASKTLTTTLIGRAVYEKKLDLNMTLNNAFADLKGKSLRAPGNKMDKIDEEATIETLVTMTYPYKWNEFYESDITQSTFVPMLYLKDRYNMPEYAYSQAYDEQKTMGESIPPNRKTIYSGGNSNLLQYILKKTYGEREYARLPWEKLFEPLGMENCRWERDEAGHFVGSSYAYASVPDMLKYGRFYLRGGVTESGERLISEDWVEAARSIEESLGSPFTPEKYAQDLGVQSQRVFWLNKPIYKDNNPSLERIWPSPESPSDKEFPNSPSDMFFAAGHYGQLIIMIPSEDLVIARTGHDLQYWGNIDNLVSSTLECFKN